MFAMFPKDQPRFACPQTLVPHPCPAPHPVPRTASACAFSVKRRAMVAGDMIEQMGNAVDVLLEGGGGGSGQATNADGRERH